MEGSLTGSKQLGLFKAELTKQHEISHQSLYRCSWDELPRLVALAIVGLWKPGSHEVLEEPSDRKKGCLNTKRQAGHALRQKKYLKFFVENVTNRYIFAIQDSSFRSNKTMFMNSQVGLLSPEKLANSAVLAAGLSRSSGSQARFGGLIGAAVSGVKTNLVIAAIGGLAFFAAGNCTNITLPAEFRGVTIDQSGDQDR
jgi:hypothetical protein